MFQRSWSRLWGSDEDGVTWYLFRIDFRGRDLVDEFWVLDADPVFVPEDFVRGGDLHEAPALHRSRSRWWTSWGGSQWYLTCIHLTADLRVVEYWEPAPGQAPAASDVSDVASRLLGKYRA